MSESNGHPKGEQNGKPSRKGKAKKPNASTSKPAAKKPKKPGRKKGTKSATPEETQLRIDACVELLRQGYLKHQIKKALRTQFKIELSTVEKIISQGRAVLREETGQTTEEHRADALAYYNRILTDKNAPLHLKIKARTRLDKILGIEQHNVNVNLGWQRKAREAGMDPEEFKSAMVDILRERALKSGGDDDD